MSAAPHEGAERDPFALTASAEDYVPSAAIERALAEALAALAEDRVPVISGPAGLGKTLLLHLLARASAERCRPLYVPYCSLSPEELASLVLGLLDWGRDEDPELALLDAARRVAESGRRLLLLVDDAASLPGETAAQLAHWLNASGGALQIAMAGLPGASLRHARDAFGDRAEDVTLASGLRTDEIRSYVDNRLARAGAEPAIRAAFDDAALAELERVSAGNPRRLNLAAQAIVRNAYAAEAAPQEGRADASRGASEAAAAAHPSERSFADVPTGVGEYRFVRGRFVDPQTGERLATPGPESVWREKLSGRARDEARRAQVAPAASEPEPEIDADLGLELGRELDVEASDALAEEPDDSLFAPRLEPPPRAPRRSGSLRWVAAGIAVVAFAFGLWTEMRQRETKPAGDVAPAPPSRVVTPAPVKRLPQPSPPAEATATAQAAAPEPRAPAPEAPPAETPALAPEASAIAGAEPTPPERAPEALAETEPAAPEPAVPLAEPAAPEPAAPEPAAPPTETVSIAINATPWAVIEIDGEEVGETPLAGIELTTGRHRFRARMPDGTVRERVVRIDADTPTVVFE
jgi:type II secretory pathway predicted ATPase ExeA